MRNLMIVLCLSLLFIRGVHGQTQLQNPLSYINIQVDYKGPATDTIIIVMQNALYPNLDNLHHQNIKADSVSGRRSFFRIPVQDSSGYLSLAKLLPEHLKKQYDLKGILLNYYWEFGDDIKIDISFPFNERPEDAVSTFSGKGSEKYQARNELINFLVKDIAYVDMKDSTFHNGDPDAIEKVESIYKKYESKMSFKSLQVLKADRFYRRNHSTSVNIFSYAIRDSIRRKKFSHDFDSILFKIDISDRGKEYYRNSIMYPRYYLNTLFDQTVAYYSQMYPYKVFRKILQEKDQEIRDKLLVMFFLRNDGDDSTAVQFKEALKIIKVKKYALALEEVRFKYQPVELAKYNFEDESGKAVNLSTYDGKVVLIDLWFTGCGGCAAYYGNTVSKVEEYFKGNEGFKVISIGVDKHRELWRKGIASGIYTSAQKAVNLHVGPPGVRHPFIRDFNIPAMPCAILINKRGYIELFNTTSLYNESTLKEEIDKLLHQS